MNVLNMRKVSGLGLVCAGMAVVSCTFLYELERDQCEQQSDCAHLGLVNHKCDLGVCIFDPAIGTGGTGGGTGGAGGTGNAPSGGGGSDGGTGGSDPTGGAAGSGGDETGGAAGMGGTPPECTTHKQCVEANQGEPYWCRPSDQTCVALKDGECSLVAGAENLSQTAYPVQLFGALGAVDPLIPTPSPSTQNFELVVKEFTTKKAWWVNGKTVLPVGVLCNVKGTQPEDNDETLDHLVHTLGIRGIASTLSSTELKRSFERLYQEGKGEDVFFISAFDSDSDLALLEDEGMVWHLLPDSKEVAAAYVPLIRRVEDFINPEVDGGRPPIRVANVVSNEVTLLDDMGGYVGEKAVFNGKTAAENFSDNNYRRFNVTTSVSDNSAKIVELKEFRPHIVVSAAGKEFITQVMTALEADWEDHAGGQARPFYILSPHNVGYSELAQLMTNGTQLRKRVVGINPAAAEDLRLYTDYLQRLQAEFGTSAAAGSENFYDAAYFLLYAMSAAGNVDPTGKRIAAGMLRLVEGTQEYDVGTGHQANIISWLKTPSSTMALQGTLGPPDFLTSAGTRKGSGSVWCIEGIPPNNLTYHLDVLRHDEEADVLVGDISICNIGDF